MMPGGIPGGGAKPVYHGRITEQASRRSASFVRREESASFTVRYRFRRTTPKEASESRYVPFWHIKCFACAATIMCSVASGRLYRSPRGSSLKHLLFSEMALKVAMTSVTAETAVILRPPANLFSG